MVSDPYKVLGISPDATNDEVKKAYRELSRKYHPDNVVNNPLADLAEEKFKEVQEAYKQIMDERENGGSTRGNSGYGRSYSSSSSAGSDDAMRFNAVRNYINARRYQEAMTALRSINSESGEWHYLYAVISASTGNNVDALNHAQTAVNMEPGNTEYRMFLNQLNMRGQRYSGGYNGYGGYGQYNSGRPSYDAGNLCCDLICLDSCCECMGGDLIGCI